MKMDPDVSDLDKFEEAYAEFGKLTEGVDPKALDRHLAGQARMLLDFHLQVVSPLCNRWRMYPRPGPWQG